jgi:hypothetical protein
MAFNEESKENRAATGNSTDSIQIYYDGDYGKTAMTMGFYTKNRSCKGFIKMHPAFAEKQENNQVFNYDQKHSVFFTIAIEDVLAIKKGMTLLEKNLKNKELAAKETDPAAAAKLLKGLTENFAIKHFGDKGKTMLQMGVDIADAGMYLFLFEFDESGTEAVKELFFDFKMPEAKLLINVNSEFEPTKTLTINADLEAFKIWLDSAIRVCTKEYQHQPAIIGGGTSSKRDSAPLAPRKSPRDRKVSPGDAPRKTVEPITMDAASTLFNSDDDDDE